MRQNFPRINSVYNIYVYLKEQKSAEKKIFDKSLLWEIHKKSLAAYPLKILDGLELYKIGVIDLNVCARAFAINQSVRTLRIELKKKYSFIKDIANFDDVICVIIKKSKAFESFLEEKNKKEFRDFAGEIIKRNDIENVCHEDSLKYIFVERTYYNSHGLYRDGVCDDDGIVL